GSGSDSTTMKPDPEVVRASLRLMQRMDGLARELRRRIIEAAEILPAATAATSPSAAAASLSSLRAWFESSCGPGDPGLLLRRSVLLYPDSLGRCSLHVAVRFQTVEILDYLLAQAGVKGEIVAAEVEAEAARHGQVHENENENENGGGGDPS